jgi:hypothetical protein
MILPNRFIVTCLSLQHGLRLVTQRGFKRREEVVLGVLIIIRI